MPKRAIKNYSLPSGSTGVETIISLRNTAVVLLGARLDWYAATSAATSAQRIKATVTPMLMTERPVSNGWLACATQVTTKSIAYNATASVQTHFYPPANQGFYSVAVDGFKLRFSRGSSTKGAVVINTFITYTTEGDGLTV